MNLYGLHEPKIEDLQKVIELFNSDDESITEYWVDLSRFFIKGNDNELMLRFTEIQNRITIARINFKHRRLGYATQLLDYLKEYAKKHNFNNIYLESVLTPEFQSFAKKHNFVNIDDGFPLIEGYYLNWKLDFNVQKE